MNELIAGYTSPHAALLAESTLSRRQTELSISCSDVAVLSRVTEDLTTIRESIRLNKKRRRPGALLTRRPSARIRAEQDRTPVLDWIKQKTGMREQT